MELDKQHVEVFFFGSPAEGFTSYPSSFSNRVNGLDKATADYKLECRYRVSQNGTRIQYAEYGLTGIGQHGKSRGGRNFGIWVDIQGYKIDEIGRTKILEYIKEFINDGIVKNSNIFKEDNSKSKHFIINSFNDVASDLDKLINAFKEHFIQDFKEHFRPINNTDNFIIDLNPVKEKEQPRLERTVNFTKEREIVRKEITDIPSSHHETELRTPFPYTKLNTVLLIVLLIIYAFYDSSKEYNTDYKKDTFESNDSKGNDEAERVVVENERLKRKIEELEIKLSNQKTPKNIEDLTEKVNELSNKINLLPSEEDVKVIQEIIGIESKLIDGKWGKKSKAKMESYLKKIK